MWVLSYRFNLIGVTINIMLKYFLLFLLLLSGCEDQKTTQDITLKENNTTIEQNDQATKKNNHPAKEEPAICENLSVAECLTIIIPTIWDREVEKDCS